MSARAIGYAAAICAAGLVLGTAAVFAWGPVRTLPTPAPTVTITPPPRIVLRTLPPVIVERTVYVTRANRSQVRTPITEAFWACIAKHESGTRWNYQDGTYGGAFNISNRTWRGFGAARKYGVPTADLASPAVQLKVAKRIAHVQGLHNAFPQTSRMCGA